MNEQGDVIHAQANKRDTKSAHSERSAPEQRQNAERGCTEHGQRELRNDELRTEAGEIDCCEASHIYHDRLSTLLRAARALLLTSIGVLAAGLYANDDMSQDHRPIFIASAGT